MFKFFGMAGEAYLRTVPLRKMLKYKTLTLRQKACLIEEASKCICLKTKLAEKHDVPLLAVCSIMKNKRKIVEAYGKTHPLNCLRVRFPLCPDVEDAPIAWLQHATATHFPVNSTILREKANDIALLFGHEEFKCSRSGSPASSSGIT